MSGKYDHIIGLPHHVSKKHPQMSNYDRAAQFSSFKALTGFEDEIDESARYVEKRKPLTEMQQDALNKTFQKLEELDLPLITVTYFVADEKKTGGVYMKYTGHFRILDINCLYQRSELFPCMHCASPPRQRHCKPYGLIRHVLHIHTDKYIYFTSGCKLIMDCFVHEHITIISEL